MKTAVVFYSMLGNTEYVAEKIVAGLGEMGNLFRIEPKKAYPDKGVMKFFWGGKSAIMSEKPVLQPYEFNAGEYDRIIFGTPVWASNFAPPLRTFIDENPEVKNKQLAVALCFSGGGADKAIDKLKKYLEITEFEAELVLVDPKDKVKQEDDVLIREFCVKLK